MSESCIVVIAAPDLLPSLKARVEDADTEVLEFSPADALEALETITERRPQVAVLERLFAVTPRGAALINRIKADPTLRDTEIRVLAHDSDYARVIPRAAPPAAPALDQRGTRRAPRFKIADGVTVKIDGKSATLVDLSTVGAQVVSPTVLKPNQRVAVTLTAEAGPFRVNAEIAWTSFEIPPEGGARYRAGVAFVDADAAALELFCQTNKV